MTLSEMHCAARAWQHAAQWADSRSQLPAGAEQLDFPPAWPKASACTQASDSSNYIRATAMDGSGPSEGVTFGLRMHEGSGKLESYGGDLANVRWTLSDAEQLKATKPGP